jgi:CDP-glucose 4,6-dehydratase
MTGDRTWAERSVLVTGATGMVGSALTRTLIDSGARVAALVADHDPQSELIRSGTIAEITVVDGRLEDVDAVERAVAGNDVEVIFHLGAQTIVSTAHRSPRATLESNVQGTWNVLDVARLHPTLVRSVVVASSDKAYGESPVLPYTEDMPLAGTFPYEVSKSMTDLVARSYALTYGVPVAIARCGNIYGPGDLNWSRIVPGTFRSILRDEQPIIRSDGKFLRDYLHVDDVVSGYLALVDVAGKDPGVAYNFSDESPASVLKIYEACCVAAGVPGLEPKILDQAVGEIRDQYLDASRARSELQWRAQTGLADGLARTFPWYAELLGSSR